MLRLQILDLFRHPRRIGLVLHNARILYLTRAKDMDEFEKSLSG